MAKEVFGGVSRVGRVQLLAKSLANGTNGSDGTGTPPPSCPRQWTGGSPRWLTDRLEVGGHLSPDTETKGVAR